MSRLGEEADLEREDDFELEVPLEVREPEEGLCASAEAWVSSWEQGWGLEAGGPAVEGMTWAVGMGIWLRMGWNEGLLLELQKSSVLSDGVTPSPVSPLSAVPGRRPKRLWNFSDTAGVCHSMSGNPAFLQYLKMNGLSVPRLAHV